MIERGSTRHNPQLDDELKHESQSLVQGRPGPGHVEEWRQTEGMPDDTDSGEAADALGVVGDLQEAPDGASEVDAADAVAPVESSDDGTVGPDGDFPTADPVVYSTETADGPDGDVPGADGRLETADQEALGADAIGTDSPGSRPVTPETEG